MKTYLELKAQAEELLAQAEEVRRKEVEAVVADIQMKMRLYGLTAMDLGLVDPRNSKSASKSNAPPKYRGPQGQTWSGGRGRKPDWILAALEKGESIDQFLIK